MTLSCSCPKIRSQNFHHLVACRPFICHPTAVLVRFRKPCEGISILIIVAIFARVRCLAQRAGFDTLPDLCNDESEGVLWY